MASEKKVEMEHYPKFTEYLKNEMQGYKIEDYWSCQDYPKEIKEALNNASKNGSKSGIPDRITLVSNSSEKYLFVYEAKSFNLQKALNESKHYCDFLKGITNNIYRISLTDNSFIIINHITNNKLPFNTITDLGIIKNFKLLLNRSSKIISPPTEQEKSDFITQIKSLNNCFRKIGLSGQDKIDFASSLLLLKEIYDVVDDDFKNTHFQTILNSKKIKTTLESINHISNNEDLKHLFPGFKHILSDKLIDMEKFNKLIPKDDNDNHLKSSTDGNELNHEINKLMRSKINFTNMDFDYRGMVVEEFTHGNKGGGVSKEYGEFFTPRHIIKFIIAMAGLKKNDKVFDPAFGTGGFLIEAFKQLVYLNNGKITDDLKNNQIFGNELHPWNVKSAKASLIALGDCNANLINSNFITGFSSWKINGSNEFFPDVVVMNPPFSLGGDSTEWHFIKKCFDRMKTQSSIDGKERTLISVLPYENVDLFNSMLHNHSQYLDAYISLPYGTFLKYTSVRTQIVVLKTTPKYSNTITGYIEPIFVAKVENDGFTLDNFRRENNKNDLPEILNKYIEFKNIQYNIKEYKNEIKNIENKLHNDNNYIDKAENEIKQIELNLLKEYNKFKNTDKTSLITYSEVANNGHFDKALWYKNNSAPTLGKNSNSAKKITEYFDIINQSGLFSDSSYEDYPYVEIGDIEIQTGFHKESDKPKAFNKQKSDGEIVGGIIAEKGDVLISMVRTYRGAFTVLKNNSLVSKVGFLVLRPKKNLSKENSITSHELLTMLKIDLPKLIRFINYVGDGKTYPKMTAADFTQITIDINYKEESKKQFVGYILSSLKNTYNVHSDDLATILNEYEKKNININ